MGKMLTIKNTDKLVGVDLYSKWIPCTYGWVVKSVEEVGDTYIFVLKDGNGKWGGAEIQLRREPVKYNPDNKAFLYELWAWNLNNGKAEQAFYSKKELKTVEDMVLRLGLMLEKIIPQ
jgi:hypothetical protein